MPRTPVSLRPLTPEERRDLERLAHARTAPARLVERARIILAADQGRRLPQIAVDLDLSRPTVYAWVHRFNAQGLAGLQERPRPGRPPTYTTEQRAAVLATALTDPTALGLPFGGWTLDRLQAHLNERVGVPIKRSRIDEILREEGLRWRTQETWFGARVDPEFAAKKAAIERLYTAPPEGSVVVCLDEMGPESAKSLRAKTPDEMARAYLAPGNRLGFGSPSISPISAPSRDPNLGGRVRRNWLPAR